MFLLSHCDNTFEYRFDFRWINSKKSVSGLEGFFLRLRLGKWAEGLGGTGYHVARIEGITRITSYSIVTHCWF